MKGAPEGPFADEVLRILERRAARIAKPHRQEERLDGIEVVVIRLGGEQYGIDVQHIREIQPLETLVPVPGLPSIWAGLINLRGVLSPVMDVARYLGLDPGSEGRRQVVVVFSDEMVVGLLAHHVVGLRSLTPEEVGPPLDKDMNGRARRDAVSGITTDMLLLLDLEALLQDRSLIVNDDGSQKGV